MRQRAFLQSWTRPSQPTAQPTAQPRARSQLALLTALGNRGVGDYLQRASRAMQPSQGPLPAAVAQHMEQRFGTSFSSVTIRRDDPDVARLGASALTSGEQIRMAPGQYRPEHPRGLALLGHELTHVVQQRRANTEARPAGISPPPYHDRAVEAEADRLGDRAARGLSVEVRGRARGVQARMGFEFQGSNRIEFGFFDRGASEERWVPAGRDQSLLHGRNGRPHVKLKPDTRGDYEFTTNPYDSVSALLQEVEEAVELTGALNGWSSGGAALIAQRARTSPHRAAIHRGPNWSTMAEVNADRARHPGGSSSAAAVRMVISDASFGANPQFTEGVRLEEIEGFMRENLGDWEPVGRRSSDMSAAVDTVVAHTSVAPEFGRLSPLNQARVRGFLAVLIASFIYCRRYAPGDPVVKNAFSIMHRTRFNAMFASLEADAASLVRRRIFGGEAPIYDAFGASRSEYLFPGGYDNETSVERSRARAERARAQGRPIPPPRGMFRGPQVGEWIQSILTRSGHDLLSPLEHGSSSMGEFGMDEAPDGSDSLVVLEVRNWGTRIEHLYREALEGSSLEALARRSRLRQRGVRWSPGDPLPNYIEAASWLLWARGRLGDAIIGTTAAPGPRRGNFTP